MTDNTQHSPDQLSEAQSWTPSLSSLQYHSGSSLFTYGGDLTLDTLDYGQLESRTPSQSGTPGGSTTSHHQRLARSINPSIYGGDLTLDTLGYSQLESRTPSQSGTPGGSTTSHRQRLARSINPSTLSYYSLDVQETLIHAKNLFVVAAFASGYFFHHRRSPHFSVFRSFALEALAQASIYRESSGKCFQVNSILLS